MYFNVQKSDVIALNLSWFGLYISLEFMVMLFAILSFGTLLRVWWFHRHADPHWK